MPGMTTTQEAAPASRHEILLAGLRTMIADGELTPGARVPEPLLCERFGVSRTPLREALKVLAAEGLIELLPNRGARIARLTAADAEAVLQVVGALEALAGELACARLDAATLAELRALHYQMLAHRLRDELADYYRINRRIHETIVAAAGNPVLATLYHGLSGRVQRVRYLAPMSPAQWDRALADHEEILTALEARDARRLGEILRRHLDHKAGDVIAGGYADAGPAAGGVP